MNGWLLTGATGFLGRHVLDALHEAGGSAPPVAVIGRRRPEGLQSGAFVPADLEDPDSLARAVAEVQPHVVIHAAGLTPPVENPSRFEQVNTQGTIHLLHALEALGKPVRVVIVGSAAEYGPTAPEDLPINEHHLCRPLDAYGRSKWLASTAGLLVRRPVESMVARVFNPIGPGMPESQAFGRFAARLASPESDPLSLRVGNLESRRDFVDARDVARALIALAFRGRRGRVYNVGSGVARRVGDGLDRLIELSGRRVVVESDLGSGGVAESRADISRIVRETGWEPRITWEQSLKDLWESTVAVNNTEFPRNVA